MAEFVYDSGLPEDKRANYFKERGNTWENLFTIILRREGTHGRI